MKTSSYTVRFRDAETDAQYSATFPREWQAKYYADGFTDESFIEVRQ